MSTRLLPVSQKVLASDLSPPFVTTGTSASQDRVGTFYIFAPHTVSYLVKRPPVRYSYTVRERHHIIIPVKPVLSGLTFRLQMRCENVECHSSCLSCEQYGNSDLQEPYCPSAFGFRTVWLLQVRISILLPPSAGGMLQTDQSLNTVTVLTDSKTMLPFHIPPTSPNWFNTMSTLYIFLVSVAQTST